MTDVDPLLAEAFDDLGRKAPHDPDLAGSVRRRARRQAAVAGSVLAVAAVAAVSTVVAVGRPAGPAVEPGSGPTATAPAVSGCRQPETGVLPEWAWTGFSDPRAGGIPFVRSAKGDLVAILFGPLTAPPLPDRTNKILWVPNPAPSGPASPPPQEMTSAVIEASLEGSELRVRRELPGLGPSSVDLPAAGCWHLVVSWGAYTDELSLRYVPG